MNYTLITGASSGIGEAFARRLAVEKHNLILVARSENVLAELSRKFADEHGIECNYVALDLSAAGADKDLFDRTQAEGWTVDWLINNAGFGSSGDFVKLPVERELAMIDLNISALVGLTHRYLTLMRERGRGTIINVSSAAGFQPVPFMATYAATKAFVSSFTEAIAEENRPHNIRFLALCPGPTETNFFAASNFEPIQLKGQQTVDEVVETAMKAIDGNKVKVVSGWTNFFGAVAGALFPNSITTRVLAKALRSRHQAD